MDLPCGTFNQSYAKDMAILRTKTQWVLLFAFLILLFLCPQFLSNSMLTVMIFIGITIISVLGLNILTGYCGQISIGHTAFMAVGGYTSAILCAKLGWPFWAALPCAGLAGGLAGLIFGLPSLKIKGFYLLIATVAAYFIIMWLIVNMRGLTGGPDGLPVPAPQIGGFVFESKASYFYLVMIIAVLATFLAKNLVRTRVGRAFIAIRDNDLAAEVMGINLWSYKLQAFFIGCVYAGIAGSLLVHYLSFASVDEFTFMDATWYLGMLIVGGIGSTTGVIFGVIVFKVVDQLMIALGPALVAISPAIGQGAAASLSYIASGLIVMLFLIFEPRGLVHRWELVKAYYRLWPFSH